MLYAAFCGGVTDADPSTIKIFFLNWPSMLLTVSLCLNKIGIAQISACNFSGIEVFGIVVNIKWQ